MFLTKTSSRQDVTHDEIMDLLNHRSDNDVIRIRWTSNDGTAIVTTGELRLALADDAIDPAEIESLQFLPPQ
jgi:Cdc6-like AAA superfamily ATPase